MYDKARNQRITFIDRPPGSPRPELYRPNLVWDCGDKVLIIGWADCVKIARVGTRTHAAGDKPAGGGGGGGSSSSGGVPTLSGSGGGGGGIGGGVSKLGGKFAGFGSIGSKLGGLAGGLGVGGGAGGLIPIGGGKGGGSGGGGGGGGAGGDDDEDAAAAVLRYVEIVAMFQTDYFISGIAPFGDALVILAFMPDANDAEDGGGGGGGGGAAEKNANGGGGGGGGESNGANGTDGRRRPSQRPEVRIVSWSNEDLTCDALGGAVQVECSSHPYSLKAPGLNPWSL
jgi:hypothetical protein